MLTTKEMRLVTIQRVHHKRDTGNSGNHCRGQRLKQLKLHYADDTVASTEKNLQNLLNTIDEESEKVCLGPNSKKTVTTVISKKKYLHAMSS